MTTSNAIETNTVKNALYVPLEAVAVDGTTPFVYKRDGARVTKQQVETGLANENEIVIAKLAPDMLLPAHAAPLG